MTQLAYPNDDREEAVNPDLGRFIRVETERMPWSGSPAEGVLRKRLELIEILGSGGSGGSGAPRLTTLVRFAPGSIFPAHVHDGGEEFLVLEGTFSDDRGDYPAGTYVRNPPGSRHATSSREGCTLFVKLRQFAPGDQATVVMDTRTAAWQPGPGPGVELLLLHRHAGEQVSLLRLASNAVLETTGYARGAEILVLAGMLTDEHGDHPTGTWLRYPPGSAHTPSSRSGCTLYLKRGHLA